MSSGNLKALFWIVGFITVVWADDTCGTKFVELEKKLLKQYSEQLRGYEKYNLGMAESSSVCSKEDVHHEVVIFVPYIKKVDKYEKVLSFLIAIIDKKHQVKESYLDKDVMKTIYMTCLFKIDVQRYRALSANRPFSIVVENILDGPPTSSLSKLFIYKRDKLKPILSNLTINSFDEEMEDFLMEREATLQKLKSNVEYEPLTFKDKYAYGVSPYAISSETTNTKEFEWSVNLDDITCYYKDEKYTCNRKPVFNLDDVEANTKKGWRYRKIVLLAMLYEEPLSEKNIKIYNNMAYNLRENKHKDESKFLSKILKKKFPERGGDFILQDIREKQKIVTKDLVMQRVYKNRSLLASYDILEHMLQKFKNKMDKEAYEELIKEQKEWEKGRVFCSLLDIEENETIDYCLLEQYYSRIKYLNKNLEVGEALLPSYQRLLGYYRSDFIDISKMHIKFSKSELCNKNDESHLRGLVLFYLYYYAFASFQNYGNFESSQIDNLNYGGYGFVKKIFDRVDEKQIQRYIKLAIDSLHENDRKSVFQLLKKLKDSYVVFKNHASKKMIKKLKNQHEIRAEDIDINLLNKDECLNNNFYIHRILVNQNEVQHGQYITFNDFVYTFWFRRYNDETIEKMKELIDNLLESLKKGV